MGSEEYKLFKKVTIIGHLAKNVPVDYLMILERHQLPV
jgi:hypothetical protein